MNGVAGETEESRSSPASACKQRQAKGDQQLLLCHKTKVQTNLLRAELNYPHKKMIPASQGSKT